MYKPWVSQGKLGKQYPEGVSDRTLVDIKLAFGAVLLGVRAKMFFWDHRGDESITEWRLHEERL